MNDIVIVDYVRSPFTPAKKGDLSNVRPDDVAADVVRSLVHKTKVDTAAIEDLVVGCAFPEAEQGLNLARMVGFLAGLPKTIAGTTVNRFCGSSMQAVHMAVGAIKMGAGEAFICAGVESMTRVPMAGFNPMPNPILYAEMPEAYISMGLTAENIAKKYKIARSLQEEFAVASHIKAAAAFAAGNFSGEIVGVTNGEKSVKEDGCIRGETTREALTTLEPSFDENGSVTAGTSSPLTDGAAAALVTTEAFADANGLSKLAKVKSVSVAGCAPELMGIGPVPATEKALSRAGLKITDVDIVELNEAFAVQAIACLNNLEIEIEKVNIDGGAIALGHPLGATGVRIVGKAAAILKREDKEFALATQCIGGGQGIATILEAC